MGLFFAVEITAFVTLVNAGTGVGDALQQIGNTGLWPFGQPYWPSILEDASSERSSDFPIYCLLKKASRKVFFISPSKTLKVFWTPTEMFGEDCFRDFRCDFLVVRLTIFFGVRAILDSPLFSILKRRGRRKGSVPEDYRQLR